MKIAAGWKLWSKCPDLLCRDHWWHAITRGNRVGLPRMENGSAVAHSTRSYSYCGKEMSLMLDPDHARGVGPVVADHVARCQDDASAERDRGPLSGTVHPVGSSTTTTDTFTVEAGADPDDTASAISSAAAGPRQGRAKRRTFTTQYKRQIVAEHDAAPKGAKGAVLRRERL